MQVIGKRQVNMGVQPDLQLFFCVQHDFSYQFRINGRNLCQQLNHILPVCGDERDEKLPVFLKLDFFTGLPAVANAFLQENLLLSFGIVYQYNTGIEDLFDYKHCPSPPILNAICQSRSAPLVAMTF